MAIRVNKAKCIGSAMCTAVAPDLFTLDADGLAEPLTQTVDGDEAIALDEAVAICPVAAIQGDRRG